MAIMNRAAFRKSLQAGLNAIFGLEYNNKPELWPKIFEKRTSEKSYEEQVIYSGLGPAALKPEGGFITYDTGSESYVARWQHETIALAFSVTEELIEDNLYASVGGEYTRALKRSFRHTKEVKGANILNNGFSASFKGGDGVALFSTAHPLFGGGTLANKPATDADLSEAALEDALTNIGQFVDERGLKTFSEAKILVVPKALEWTANRLLYSTLRPGTADNDINAINYTGMFPGGFSANNYLTDPKAWFIVTDVPKGLQYMERLALTTSLEGVGDFDSGNLRFKGRERYAFNWADPRGAYGSSGVAV